MPLQIRQRAIVQVAQTQPGSSPYVNRRPMRVPGSLNGSTLQELLMAVYPFAGIQYWEDILSKALLLVDEQPALLNQRVHCGDRIIRLVPDTVEPQINPAIEVLYEDEDLLVINKPAPLPMHPCGRFNKNSLTELAKVAWPDLELRPAHRLDANTTGLAVFTRHRKAAGVVQFQFERQAVTKIYLSHVEGLPNERHFSVDSAISAKADREGCRKVTEDGQASLTDFEVLADCGDNTSIVQARPHTGRTNQIRIHLQTAGHPIVGDAAYGSDKKLVHGFTSEDATLRLHAWKLEFTHPTTAQSVQFEAPLPEWAGALRRSAGLSFP